MKLIINPLSAKGGRMPGHGWKRPLALILSCSWAAPRRPAARSLSTGTLRI